MKLLLDTCAYTSLMQGWPEVADRVRRAERIFLSAVVAGELIFGFRHGTRYESNIAELRAFLDNPYVEFLSVTITTSDRFGRIAAELRRKGRPDSPCGIATRTPRLKPTSAKPKEIWRRQDLWPRRDQFH